MTALTLKISRKDTGANVPPAAAEGTIRKDTAENSAPGLAGAAVKQRRYRARLKQHQIAVCVPVDEGIINFLIRTGWLAERDACKRERIGEAIARMISEAERHRYP